MDAPNDHDVVLLPHALGTIPKGELFVEKGRSVGANNGG